jgi:hypothetical protein
VALSGDLVEHELTCLANTATFDTLLSDLCFGPAQEGPAAPGSGPGHDRLGADMTG